MSAKREAPSTVGESGGFETAQETPKSSSEEEISVASTAVKVAESSAGVKVAGSYKTGQGEGSSNTGQVPRSSNTGQGDGSSNTGQGDGSSTTGQGTLGCSVCSLLFRQNLSCQGEGVCAIITDQEIPSAALFTERFRTLLIDMYQNDFDKFRYHIGVIAAGVVQVNGSVRNEVQVNGSVENEGVCRRMQKAIKNGYQALVNGCAGACCGTVGAYLAQLCMGCFGG